MIHSKNDVSVGSKGELRGRIRARSLVVSGFVDGVVCCERIEVLPNGKLTGHVVCSEMVIESGGQFIGQRHEVNEQGQLSHLTQNATELSSQFAQLINASKPNDNLVDLPQSEEKVGS